MRKTVRDVLIAQGLSVVTAEGFAAANRLMMARGARFSILVTDVDLQDGSGWNVARLARRIWPHVPILYMSAEAQAEFDVQAVPASVLLSKPFDGRELTRALACLGLWGEISEAA